MLVNSIIDIMNNYYLFKFKYVVGTPESQPIFDSDVDIKIWVSREGVIISGRKLCGHIGNSLFKVGGTAVNSPLARSRTMLCKWEDISIYTPRTKRNRSLNKDNAITMYSGVSYSLTRGSDIINGLIRSASRYRDQIIRRKGEGVSKSVLDSLVSNGYYYREGNDMFFLRKPEGKYFFKKMMSYSEFCKVILEDKEKVIRNFNVY